MANHLLAVPSAGPFTGITAILFDMDGVLTSTQQLHTSAWSQVISEFFRDNGVQRYSDDDYFRYLDGRTRDAGIRAVLASRDLPVDDATVDALAEAKNRVFLAAMAASGAATYPGSLAFLGTAVAAGVETAVVSSSKNADEVLRGAGIRDRFAVIIDGNYAAANSLAGKPSPATYLAAAEELGVEPGRCAVIEDAISGVAAGRAGDFGLVVGVDRGAGAAALSAGGADLIVGDLSELLDSAVAASLGDLA